MPESDQNQNLGLSIRSLFYQNLYIPLTESQRIWNDITLLKQCFGYDLITIIALFHQYKMSGKIKLETVNNAIHSITFDNGQIQFIELADTDTRLGTLIVNHRLITKPMLDKALAEKGDLPIGAYLVKKGLISKEQIGMVLLTQSRLRLSKLISDEKFNISIEQVESKIQTSELNIGQFYLLINDWILSKFDHDWIHAHYLEYYNYKVQVNWDKAIASEFQKYSLIYLSNENFIELIDQQTIQDLSVLFEKNSNLFKALHFLIIINWIEITPTNEPALPEVKIKHIYKLLMNKSGPDLLYTASLITKQNSQDIDKIYEDLMQNYLGPESFHNDFKLEIDKKMINLMINQKNMKQKSADFSTDSLKPKVHQQIDLQLIHNYIIAQKYNEALIYIKKFKDLIETESKLQLYSAWAHLGLALFKGTQISLMTLEKEFTSILPEDMSSADYHYVKKQDTPANNSLKKAISMDSQIKNYPVLKSIFDWFN